MDSPLQPSSLLPASVSSSSGGANVDLVAKSNAGSLSSTSDVLATGLGANGRRSAYSWESAPKEWRLIHEAWRQKGERHHWRAKRHKPTKGDAEAAHLTGNQYNIIRHSPEFWLWFADQEDLVSAEIEARLAGCKRDILEIAEGLQKCDPIRLTAIKEVLANMDPEWGTQKVKVEVTDPREDAAVKATVTVLLAALKGPPGAPQTHELPPPGPVGPESDLDDF